MKKQVLTPGICYPYLIWSILYYNCLTPTSVADSKQLSGYVVLGFKPPIKSLKEFHASYLIGKSVSLSLLPKEFPKSRIKYTFWGQIFILDKYAIFHVQNPF
jgi:hypothetical protein